jgi:hypothetical protein
MWVRIANWVVATNGFAVGTLLDAGLAVVLAAIATGSLRLLCGFL